MNRHCAEFFLIALVLASALLLPPLAWSQQNGGAGSANVSGTVYMEKDNRPVFSAYVRLCDAGGVEVAEMFTSDSGEFVFHGIAPAKYTLQISALGFETITLDVDLAFVSDRGVPVYLKPVAATTTETAAGASSASVSVHELSLPQAARDAFAAGKKKMYVDKNLSGALADFQATVTAAPGYYEAYYQMALAHLTLGNSGEAEANLRKSIAASGDKYGEAEVGLGTVLLDRGQSAEADPLGAATAVQLRTGPVVVQPAQGFRSIEVGGARTGALAGFTNHLQAIRQYSFARAGLSGGAGGYRSVSETRPAKRGRNPGQAAAGAGSAENREWERTLTIWVRRIS